MLAKLITAGGGILPQTRDCVITGHTPSSGDCLSGNVPHIGRCILGKTD